MAVVSLEGSRPLHLQVRRLQDMHQQALEKGWASGLTALPEGVFDLEKSIMRKVGLVIWLSTGLSIAPWRTP